MPATLQKQRVRNMRLYTTQPTRKRPRPTALKDYTRRLGRVGRSRSQPCPSKGPTATRQLTQCKPLIDMLKQCLWHEIHPKGPTATRQLVQHHLCAHGLLRIICFVTANNKPHLRPLTVRLSSYILQNIPPPSTLSKKAKVDQTQKRRASSPHLSTSKSRPDNHTSRCISCLRARKSPNEHARKLMLLSCYH